MTTRAERIAELRLKLLDYHRMAIDSEPGSDDRTVLTLIANETCRELVLLLAAIHSPKKGA